MRLLKDLLPRLALLLALLIPLPALGETLTSPLRLLAFGDSLTQGYGLESGAAFPVQLEQALRARGWDVEVINAGNSGDTTAAGLARLEWSLSDLPDAVLLELGANDALRGIDPRQTRANLDQILKRMSEQNLPVLLAGMRAPRNLGSRYTQSFDGIFPALAEAHRVRLYPFFLEGVALEPSLNQADGIHPNAKGVQVIVEKITPFAEELLRQAAEKKKNN